MYCIVWFNNEQCNTYNDDKVHNHGKTMFMGCRPRNLDRIYHKRNIMQGWECKIWRFWNEIVSSFHILSKYESTDVLQCNWISCRKVSLIYIPLFRDLSLFYHLHFTKKPFNFNRYKSEINRCFKSRMLYFVHIIT